MAKPAKTFKDLVVWQKAHRFVLATYLLTSSFPRSEIYCLTSQMRRAAISIPANIAEGFKKRGPSDKMRFLNVAQGSLEELRAGIPGETGTQKTLEQIFLSIVGQTEGGRPPLEELSWLT